MHNFSEKEARRIADGLPPWESMSFACGGWLMLYMFGVAKALQQTGLTKGVKYVGCSAGALTSVGLAMDGNFDQAVNFCCDYCLPEAYGKVNGLFCLQDYVTKCLELCILDKFRVIPAESLQVAITRLPFFTKERVVDHPTKEGLVKSLHASSAAFPFAPLTVIDGKWYIDGGLSDFQPVVDEDTVTVSPFYFSDCDIKPSRYVPLWWTFFPPKSKDTVDWLYNMGWEDCMQYIRARGIPISQNNPALNRVYGRNMHPYDKPRQVSMRRFLGYNINNITTEFLSFIMDAFLLFLLVVIWKPLALVLIYIELCIKLLLLLTVMLFQQLLELPGIKHIVKIFGKMYGFFMLLINIFNGQIFYKNKYNKLDKEIINNENIIKKQIDELINNNNQSQLYRELVECFTCVWSLSLFLRFISGRPSSVELRKHDLLHKTSVLYRVFRHII